MGSYFRCHFCNSSQDDPRCNRDRHQCSTNRFSSLLEPHILDFPETNLCDCWSFRFCPDHAKEFVHLSNHGLFGALFLVSSRSSQLRCIPFCKHFHAIPYLEYGAWLVGLRNRCLLPVHGISELCLPILTCDHGLG